MKVLVTGGAGYIGSLLIPQLLARRCRVTIYDNYLNGTKQTPMAAIDSQVEFVSGDIRDTSRLQSAMQGNDLIVHLAAIVGYPACDSDPAAATSTNIAGTRNLVSALQGRELIFASTCSIYGNVRGICHEETPPAPLTLYGSTKWEAEQICRDAGGVALRFATLFGAAPRQRLDLLVNHFVHQALHTGRLTLYEGGFRRAFLHVADAARAILTAIDHYNQMRGQAYNVGDRSLQATKRQIADEIKRHVDYTLLESDVGQDPDKRDYEVSFDKFNHLGFQARISIPDGIAELVKVLRHFSASQE